MFRYIRSMSYDRQTLMNNLMNKAEQLTDHLIRLYLFPDTEYVNHWRKEVWTFLSKMPKMKGNNKLPNSKLIYSGIAGYLDQTEDMMNFVIDEYDSLTPQRFDCNELHNMLDQYFHWISNELSSRSAITSKEVYNKLEEIGL